MKKFSRRESAITKEILGYLRNIGDCHAEKLYGNPYQAGQPDILCVYQGRAYFFEVKRPGGKATILQQRKLQQWAGAHARTAVVTSVADVQSFL